MNNSTYILTVIVVLVVGISGLASSIENPGIRNPAGVSSVPPSSLGSGLVNSPNPIDRSSNLAVTGQVRRGMHFRGPVPYGSRTDLGSGLGTTVLDSFLRDSAGSEDFGRYRGSYGSQPYYSRLRTVPTTRPGRSGVFAPIDTRVTGRPQDVYGTEALTKKKDTPGRESLSSLLGPGARPLTAEEIRRLASGETRVRQKTESTSAELYRRQLQQLRLDLLEMRGRTPDVKTDDKEKRDLLSLLPEPGGRRTQRDFDLTAQLPKTQEVIQSSGKTRLLKVGDDQSPYQLKTQEDSVNELLESDTATMKDLLSPQDLEQSDLMPPAKTPDSLTSTDLEMLKEQIANLRRQISGSLTDDTVPVGTGKIGVPLTPAPAKPRTAEPGRPYSPTTDSLVPPTGTLPPKRIKTPGTGLGQVGTGTSEVDKINQLPDKVLAERARQIMGPYKTPESFSQARYKTYMAQAQEYMKLGRYYQAANTFAQASIFDSKQPAAVAGRSMALFAAGEYVSSALFLSRAIEMSPDYVRSDLDFTAAMGDKDKLATRIADARECLERSCAPELEFLLAYTYYRMGRLEPAKQAIEAAEKEMPKSRAVKVVKEAIDAARKTPKQQ